MLILFSWKNLKIYMKIRKSSLFFKIFVGIILIQLYIARVGSGFKSGSGSGKKAPDLQPCGSGSIILS